MPKPHPAQHYLALGLIASLAVHVGVGVVAGVTPAGFHPHADQSQGVEMALLFDPPSPEPSEPDEVELGLEHSDAQTDTWVGFQEATDHQAALSEVEQSALTPTPAGGQPTPASIASTPIPEASPQPDQPAEQLAENSDQPDVPPPEPTETPIDPQAEAPVKPPVEPPAELPPDLPPVESPTPDSPLTDQPSAPETQAVEPIIPAPRPDPLLDVPSDMPLIPTLPPPPDPLLESLPPEIPVEFIDPAILLAAPIPPPAAQTPQPAAPEPASPTTPQTPEPAAPSAASEPTPPGEGGLLPGEKSPSESSASALAAPIDVRPGRVLAAQGLQITTVRPVFSTSVVALARPRSPTLVIEFGSDGRVRRARYVEGRSTGEPEVDRPLLDAIYRWTAAGEPLEHLSDNPDDTVAITMRIILR